LAIVGDVAGKGMLAAMRVSVILGILRREDARGPGTVLQQLNDTMILQGDMGLTTACCVRIEKDGRFTVANAGHISPYIAGQEVTTAGALPLGIAPDQEYEQSEGSLEEGETLVLMSDGVVEARSAANELFGFERLARLTRLPACEIAQTAKLFGQEDDITVMTLRCLA
jgi:serine phosphatase RsbU (regulator of sigma subunit)